MNYELFTRIAEVLEEDAKDADLLLEDVERLTEMGFLTETVFALSALVHALKKENIMLEKWCDIAMAEGE